MLQLKKKEEKAEADEIKKFNRREYCYSSFTKTFNLPETADQHKIQAEYKDGIFLYINLAKKEEARILSREILVK